MFIKCVASVLQDAPAEAEVLYEGGVFYFDDNRKWKERYVVVRANYCLDCHDSLQVSMTRKPTLTLKCKYTLTCKRTCDLLLLSSFIRVLLKGFLRATSCCLQGAQSWPQRRRTWPWWTSVFLMMPVSKRLETSNQRKLDKISHFYKSHEALRWISRVVLMNTVTVPLTLLITYLASFCVVHSSTGNHLLYLYPSQFKAI